MKRPARKRTLNRVASKESIIDAAERLFFSHGYLGASLDDISAQSAFTKGAIYFYFKDKEDVLMAVLARVRLVVLDPFVRALELRNGTATDALCRFLQCQASIAKNDPRKILLAVLLSIELNGTNSKSAHYVSGGYRRIAMALEQAILAGQARKEFRTDLPARELASVILALNDGLMLEWIRNGRKGNGTELIKVMRSVLWGGMVSNGGPSPSLPPALDNDLVAEPAILKHAH